MRNILRATTVLVVAATAFAARPAAAEDWAAEKAKLATTAAQEGELVVFCQPNKRVRDYLLAEWPKAYPNVKLSLVVVPASQFLVRIATERNAGKYVWDLGFSGAITGFRLAKSHYVDPILPELKDPTVADPKVWGGWDQPFVDLEKKYVFSVQVALKTPVYNALKLSPEKVAKEKLEVLFDPSLKDRVIWHDPKIPGGGQQYAIYLRNRWGDNKLRRFILDQRVKFVAQQNQVVEALARGTAWLGLGPGNAHALIERYVKAGVKADIRTFGNTPDLADITIGGSTLYAIKNRPHPAATRLFLNWLLSRDVEAGLAAATEQNTRRKDVASVLAPESTPIPGAKYLAPQREEHTAALLDAVKFVGEVRKEMH